ncbi:MAG: alcohol acetyltransferase, partial [Eggerthellaceae bacterium]|nr:alcohol acetyltransferase [Eggerthellaceae bacterium]
ATPTYMYYRLPASEVKAKSKEIGVSITSLVIAAVIYSVRTTMNQKDKMRAVRLDVPVDLRNYFQSATVKNFFGLAFISYENPGDDVPFDELCRIVQEQLKAGTTAESLKRRMNSMVSLEKNSFVKIAPLFLKDIVLGIAERQAAREVTTTVSSIGVVPLNPKIAPYVKSIDTLTSTVGLNFLASTCGDALSIGVTSVFPNHDVVKALVRLFSSWGIHGEISINKNREQVEIDLRQAAFGSTIMPKDKGDKS